MSLKREFIVLGWAMALSGCTAEVTGIGAPDEPVGESQGALLGDNALSANALNLNALNLNALNLNALNLNGLSAQNLAAIQDPGPNGALARDFMRYATSCALSSTESFDFSWTDARGVVHDESYPGLLGVAPAWASGPLDDSGQRMVSSCVAARVNYYQVPVIVSARSLREPLKTLNSSRELVDYPDIEGAFWGNLFAARPYLNACYNSATVDNSRTYQRDCAAGHLLSGGDVVECGVIHIVGPCSQVCGKVNGAGQYYSSCVDRPGQSSATTKDVITTALP
ncbi:hypothetical protein SOCEGT47_058050 [Sorangium cellulosum]|uniref:Uncharacterized protein n=1 Tax=Sorangium cellulosum TaxID=56 RepID=A0A4P2Q7K0_SORCE|nr:hypothetical protein [Sorangium cellulosum]AUX25261.1 hypothetical protein SOCEGT47_058050 [Sorangium cellulosum]